MERFSQQTCPVLRADINEALKSVCQKHGLSVQMGAIRFTDMSCNAKLTFNIRADESSLDGKLDEAFNRSAFGIQAPRFNLKPEDFGRDFFVQGKKYTLSSINPRRPKFPITAKRADGRLFKFPAHVVMEALKNS